MWVFHQKLKRLAATLSKWSKSHFGDIFTKVKEFEEKARQAEENLISMNSDENRTTLHAINAEYIKYLKLEESILKQKTQLHWFQEGDVNSSYFHALVRGRRRRLHIHKIQDEEGNWIQGDIQIAKAACDHFQQIFTGEDKYIQEQALQIIPNMVSDEQNRGLQDLPTMDEVKRVVFSMNPNSAAGPDGMNGKFFQVCWDTIKEDLLPVITAFFCGQSIPKYFSHTCLVLLPKVNHPNKLSEFRPISLSNFTNKIISKLLCLRLAPILPSLISLNQSGFVKNRSISENIMLAQEIIHQIKKPNKGGNVVIKLDMAKAYDRVSWSYTCLVLRKMGFGERFIDMIWRIMSNNWYSVIVNGSRHGFFHSTRGLKQGDPLSPALFILGAEVLSRLLNRLNFHPQYHGFFMNPTGPQINHLSFADDIIIFTSGRRRSLQFIMTILSTYEEVSGQLINKHKSHFMVPSCAFPSTIRRIKKVTGFLQKNSPMTYLGCPIYIGRPRVIYYSDLVSKVLSRITGWQTKMLSYGGRAVLIKHVLQSLPIHLLTSVCPPKTTINQIHGLIADFFWGWKNDRKKYHWSSWKNLCYPYDEGGIGFRNMTDVAASFQYKHWWIFRTKKTLWGDFLLAKYCQRANPVAKKWDTGQSLVWKYMMRNKTKIEPHIQWHLTSGSSYFWWDDWLGIGPLVNFRTNPSRPNNIRVSSFLIEGQWNVDMILDAAPQDIAHLILAHQFQHQPNRSDQAVWKPNTDGKFSVSSAWDLIRIKRDKASINSYIWHKYIPFKCSFHLWRTLRGKLPTNEKLTSFGQDPVECYCCYQQGPDTIHHIFVAGHFAKHIWDYFSDLFGIDKHHSPLRNFITRWWNTKAKNGAHKLIIQSTPIFICWNLWKNRCACKYGGKTSNLTRVKYAIFKDTSNLLSTVFPYVKWPSNWTDLIRMVEGCSHEIKVFKVNWKKPPDDIVKLNTDGSALDNPGNTGIGGICRNSRGELIFAYASPMGLGTNNEAELRAALFGLAWCLQLGYTKVLLEMDSNLSVHWINQQTDHPWAINQIIGQIQNIKNQLHYFRCNHVYREANFVADALSKYSHTIPTAVLHFSAQQLPREAKAYYELDKVGLASFRRKKLKRIKKPP